MSGRMRVGVIGGGIFGATSAIVLGEQADVTLFERHDRLLAEASRANQYRHHMGYHYPRSAETIREVRAARAGFDALYGEAVVETPSYYAIARDGSRTSAEEFLRMCDAHGLPYEVAWPDRALLDPAGVSLCVRTPEPVYEYDVLCTIVDRETRRVPRIAVRLGHRVVAARRRAGGGAVLTVEQGGRRSDEAFDVVINATYANYNAFCRWMGFPARPLQLNMKELIVLRLPDAARAAVTVMDGPFATLVPTGRGDRYTLGDVPLSVHESVVVQGDEAAPEDRRHAPATRWPAMQARCAQWMPALRDGIYLESMFVTLPIQPQSGATDARPTDVTAHGDGCWSILSGKVITAVDAAKAIAAALETSVSA